MHGERVEQLVREDDTAEAAAIGPRFADVADPIHLAAELGERLRLPRPPDRGRFGDRVAELVRQRRPTTPQPAEDISRQPAVVRSRFDDLEKVVRAAAVLGLPAGEPEREQFAEHGPDAGARVEIAAATDGVPSPLVVAEARRVQRELHEPDERKHAAARRRFAADLCAERFGCFGPGHGRRFCRGFPTTPTGTRPSALRRMAACCEEVA